MSMETFTHLMGVLALIAVLVTVFTLFTRARGRAFLPSDRALALAAAIAVVTAAGSLTMSDVYPAVPCVLCWWQRILMYPLAILLPVAATRRDLALRPYLVALTMPGIAFSTWHSIVQRVPSLLGDSCAEGASCAGTWSFALQPNAGSDFYLTLPNMALIAFVTITVLLVTAPHDERTLR